MRNLKTICAFLATLACGASVTSCYFDNNCEHRRTEYSCQTVCGTVCQPENVCDIWGFCWYEEACWNNCVEDCHPYTVCENRDRYDDRCYRDRDCGPRGYCQNGACVNASQGGTVEMCGACSDSIDCYGTNSACTALNDKETVCTRYCETYKDCPNTTDYECINVSNNNGTIGQCIPKKRSCSSSYCTRDEDCNENADCIDNECVLPTANMDECATYKDCLSKGYTNNDGEFLNICVTYAEDSDQNKNNYCTIDCYSDWGCDPGYTCYLTKASLESGICFRNKENACIYDKDCFDGAVCRNGKCMLSCNNDNDCRAQYATFACKQGVCTFQQDAMVEEAGE